MSTETEHGFYQSDDDLDEDEATQYIIEQSLIQYRKLKGLNPRFVSVSLQSFLEAVHFVCSVSEFIFCAITFNSDLKPGEDPDEIFKAIKEGELVLFNLSVQIQISVKLVRSSGVMSCL